MKDFTISKKKAINPAKSSITRLTTSDLGSYYRQANSYKSLNAEEELQIAQKAKAGNIFAKKELIQANLKLVLTIARKAIHVSRIPMVDLIQEGNLGLMIAAEKFNPNLGYRFSTYATWWIKQAMFKAISEQSYCMKIPVYVQETLSKFSKIKREMERTNNSQINNKEVAEKMNLDPDKIESFLSAYTSTVSLDSNIDGKNGSEINVSDIIEDEHTNVEENVEYEELKKELSNVISTLKDREQTVIKMRFGLEDCAKKTLEDIGNIFGVTKECIRQTEKRALTKLKNNYLLQCYSN